MQYCFSEQLDIFTGKLKFTKLNKVKTKTLNLLQKQHLQN